MLISLFLHQFCLNLVQMILGYLHIFGAEEGEVKGHVGVNLRYLRLKRAAEI